MRLTRHHLWSEVAWGPTHRALTVLSGWFRSACYPLLVRGVDAPSKISNFDLPIQAKEKVLWFDVTVNDIL